MRGARNPKIPCEHHEVYDLWFTSLGYHLLRRRWSFGRVRKLPDSTQCLRQRHHTRRVALKSLWLFVTAVIDGLFCGHFGNVMCRWHLCWWGAWSASCRKLSLGPVTALLGNFSVWYLFKSIAVFGILISQTNHVCDGRRVTGRRLTFVYGQFRCTSSCRVRCNEVSENWWSGSFWIFKFCDVVVFRFPFQLWFRAKVRILWCDRRRVRILQDQIGVLFIEAIAVACQLLV